MADESVSAYGKKSILRLSVSRAGIEDAYFTSPLKVMKPFREHGVTRVMIISVSAGIMAGDTQEYDISALDGARTEISSQSFEKLHDMAGGSASRRSRVTVGRGAELMYRPLPVIPFAGSAFDSAMDIRLADDTSKLLYAEILSCGRAARGEDFMYRRYFSDVSISRAGELIYLDRVRYTPETFAMSGLCMYEEYTHLGTFVLAGYGENGAGEELAAEAREAIGEMKIDGGASVLFSGDVVVKALAHGSEPLMRLEERLKELVA